ncbi:hypothetical protein EVAR_80429_1 [Eumeta japonica]|uniref:Uncharacterized protein n=1 Tax=Eumeta variegata TaxID=151549 RepID=A0A4C1VK91_EUMVA|nr:hypothetical protein EVAR_80429_1 [Eumeta japonica]
MIQEGVDRDGGKWLAGQVAATATGTARAYDVSDVYRSSTSPSTREVPRSTPNMGESTEVLEFSRVHLRHVSKGHVKPSFSTVGQEPGASTWSKRKSCGIAHASRRGTLQDATAARREGRGAGHAHDPKCLEGESFMRLCARRGAGRGRMRVESELID